MPSQKKGKGAKKVKDLRPRKRTGTKDEDVKGGFDKSTSSTTLSSIMSRISATEAGIIANMK